MSAAETLAGAAPRGKQDWHSIAWKKVLRTVRRLQMRIVKALQQGRWGKVRALVYLLTHSFAGRAQAILRVVSNSGAKTPGVDRQRWNTPEAKTAAFDTLTRRGYQSEPLRRVYIPKSNGKERPLGIPTMRDRAMQALHLQGLDPIVETQADANSYGFRLKRSCADALVQTHRLLCKRNSPCWALEGDIRACFDQISHDWLLTHVPMDRTVLRQWLKAGYLEKNVFFATTDGTPQGGVASPALANRALDGLERLLANHFGETRRQREGNQVHLVRYADDFIITGTSETLLHDEVLPLVAQFLSIRGLELSREKTTITHVKDGFDFLGQNVRRYHNGKVLLKPSKRNVQTFLKGIREIIQGQGGSLSAGELIQVLTPKIQGWALYHRHASSARTFAYVDYQITCALWRWLRRRHRDKSARWIKSCYFPDPKPGGRAWVFCAERLTRTGEPYRVRLMKAAEVRIQRHVLIRHAANPYDPKWEMYYEGRLQTKMMGTLLGRECSLALYQKQNGRCTRCQEPFSSPNEWHLHHRQWRVYGGGEEMSNLELLHSNCHRQIHSQGLETKNCVPQGAFEKA
jgi:RNA-directed DNA polymerase